MYYEAVLGFILPMIAVGVVLASSVFYAIVKRSAALQRRMASGSRASRELLYGYLGVDRGVSTRRSASRGSVYVGKRSACVHRFPTDGVKY